MTQQSEKSMSRRSFLKVLGGGVFAFLFGSLFAGVSQVGKNPNSGYGASGYGK